MSEDALGTDLDAGIDLRFDTVELTVSPEVKVEIARLLHDNGLELDEQIENFVVCREDGRLVGCAGFDRDVIKDVAVAPGLRGTAVSLRLGGEVVKLAAGHGYHDLFLFCRPDNVKRFRGWAFHPLVEMPGVIALMENNPIALPKYLEKLSRGRRPGKTIGGVVLNANPFTLGHRYPLERVEIRKIRVERLCLFGIFRVQSGAARLKLSFDPIDIERCEIPHDRLPRLVRWHSLLPSNTSPVKSTLTRDKISTATSQSHG
jgi:hypothetical protein